MTVKNPSLRKSIDAYCRSCIVDPKSGLGTWRKQVELCTVTLCPLYAVRPKTKGRSDQKTAKQPIPEGLRRYYEQKRKESQK